MDEQLEQGLEELLEENGELRLTNQQLQGLVTKLRRDFLQERIWRTKFQISYLEGLKAVSAVGRDSAEYQSALKEMKELFPDDPCLNLLPVDYYLARKEFGKAHACIQALREATGGDDYLDAADMQISSLAGVSP
jgi:phage terminase Nu1 subunit (DNA packaging protein)